MIFAKKGLTKGFLLPIFSKASTEWLLFFKHNFISKQLRINRQIRAPFVRLIDENEEQIGEVSLEQALQMATERELDLVEVAPLSKPPVCKILDFGKYLYRQKKIEQKHKRMQRQTEMKGIRISLRIDPHDLEIKANQAKNFLEERNGVKVTLMLKGREAAHADLGLAKLDKFLEYVKDVANLEQPAKRQGNSLIMVLTPKNN